MKRVAIAVAVWAGLCVSSAAWAAQVEHKRGDFKFFVGDVPAFVQPHEVAQRWDPQAPGADEAVWRYWLYDEQADHRGGLDAEYIDYVYESRTAATLTDAGKFTIEFNPEYQTLVLHAVALRRDGQWLDRLLPDKISLARRETDFENDMADGRVSALIVLDDVRVGDVVRIRYTITGSNPILAGQSWDSTSTAWRSPMLDVHARALWDAGTKIASHQRNGAKAPVVTQTRDGTEVRIDRHGAPAIVDEGNYPVWFDPWPMVQFGPARTWGNVVDWALPLYPAPDALPADLQARIAEWRKLSDPNARLRAALRAVQDEVRYFGVEMGSSTHRPAPPATTWTRRYGDCKDKTYLLSTILEQLDIAASPALVSTTRGRGLRDIEPTAAVFNHVIVRARIGDKVVYVDPTMTQQGGDPAQYDLSAYGVALPVLAGTGALETIAAPAKPNDAVAMRERFVPQADGQQVRYEIETTYRGKAADDIRRSFAAQRQDDLARRYADYYRKRYGDLDVATPIALQDDREANTLRVSEAYLLKAPFEKEGTNTRALDLYGLALNEPVEAPRTAVRTGPLDLGTPASYRHDVAFVVPKGWRPTFSDDQESVDTDAYAFKLKVHRGEVDTDEVTVSYALDVKAHELDAAPANKHIAELRRIRDLLSSRLRFVPPAERIGAKERDDRLKNLLRDVLQDTEHKTQ